MKVGDAVANRVLRLLHEKQMTLYRLERNSGVMHGSFDRMLSGKSTSVNLTTIFKIARGFGMTIHEFLDDDVFRSPDLEID